jgi:hypothetical protein
MHLEIENLIEMALADGEVTEKEREIILRKAEVLCEDKDEVEMILDGRIALMLKELKANQQQSKPKSNKEGDMKKCPSCGAPTSSFTTKCPDCGHEFRNIEAVSSISKLHSELQRAEVEERNRSRSWVEKLDGELAVLKAVANRQKMIISSFPVPNSKEDILEFLSVSSSEAQIKTGFTLNKNIDPKTIIKQAWRSKCEQIILKARFSMKEDKVTLAEIEQFAKDIKIK